MCGEGTGAVGGTLGHAAPATDAAVYGHVFIGPAGISADKSNETSSLASRGLFHPRDMAGRMLPASPSHSQCSTSGSWWGSAVFASSGSQPGEGQMTQHQHPWAGQRHCLTCLQRAAPRDRGRGLGVPWRAWLQPRWSNPARSGAHTQLYQLPHSQLTHRSSCKYPRLILSSYFSFAGEHLPVLEPVCSW